MIEVPSQIEIVVDEMEKPEKFEKLMFLERRYILQLHPAIPEVKGPTSFICYWRIFAIANKEN